MSSPALRRSTPADSSARKLTIQEVAERSQRQLVVVAFAGVAISIGIVITFILFHELSLGGEGAVTGSSIIESEKHIVHMYKAGHHIEALQDLNQLIHDKPLQRWVRHLNLMEELLKKSNLQSNRNDNGKEGKSSSDDDLLFRQVDSALDVIQKLKKAPDDAEALKELDTHVQSILSTAANSEEDKAAEKDDGGYGRKKKEL